MESRLEIYKCLSLILLFLGISLDCYCFFFKYIYFPGHWRRGNDASHERFGQFAGGEVRCRNAISDVFIRNVHDSDETKS